MKEAVDPQKYADHQLAAWQEQTTVAETICRATAALQEGDEADRLYHVPLAPEGQSSTAAISPEGRAA